MTARIYILAVAVCGCAPACRQAKEQSSPARQEEKQNGVIGGTVVNERGEPVAGATVGVYPADRSFVGTMPSGETDSAGKFRLERFTWGRYAVCARKEADGYADICKSQFGTDRPLTASLSPEAPEANVRVTIGPRAGTLTGTIGDAVTGLPVNPIANAVTGAPAAVVLRVRPSIDNGKYLDQVVGPKFTLLIPPDADLELEVRAPGYRPWRFSASDGRQGMAFRMKSGEKRALHIRLSPELR